MTSLLDEHPLLLPVTGLAAGCVMALSWQQQLSHWVLLALLLLVVLGGAVRFPLVFLAAFWLYCVAWGMIAMQPVRASLEHPSSLGTAPLEGLMVAEGIVSRRPVPLPQGQRFELELERVFSLQGEATISGRLLVTVSKGQGSWLTGDRVRMRGVLRKPHRLGLPGEFDYSRYLALRGIDATLTVPDASLVVLMQSTARPSLQRLLDAAAYRCEQLIRQTLRDPAAAAVLMALVTGSQAGIPPDVTAAYARAGVSHILSISGFHVAVIAATVAQLLIWLFLHWHWLALRINLRRAALLATLPVMGGYLLFTGGAPATARSVVMLAAVVLALWAERESEALDALLLAALLLLVHSPAVLFDLSFQLSFLSLWGIVVLTPLLLSPFKDRLTGWGQRVALFFASSLAAVLATAVPTLVNFHQATFTGLLANLLVVPLLGYGAVVLGAVAAPAAMFAPTLASTLFWIGGWLVEISNRFVFLIADLPMVRSYQVGTVDLVAVLIGLSVVSFVTSARWRGMLLGGTSLVLLVTHLWPPQHNDGHLRCTFLSVGQAEATLLQFPDRSTMLIDGGGYLRDTGGDFGERHLVPALHALGIERIDRLVLTHPHPDHLGGLPAVAEQFPIGEFWQGPWEVAPGGDAARLQSLLIRRGTLIRRLQAGAWQVSFGGCQMTVYTPPLYEMPDDWYGEAGNEASLVLQVTFDRFSALFMADAGLQTEQRLLGLGLSPVTLLKVGHHGSRSATGERFVHQIRPQLALLSVGTGNRFGLPAPETLARLRRHGVQVYRTDHDGTVLVDTDGNDYRVTTGLGSR